MRQWRIYHPHHVLVDLKDHVHHSAYNGGGSHPPFSSTKPDTSARPAIDLTPPPPDQLDTCCSSGGCVQTSRIAGTLISSSPPYKTSYTSISGGSAPMPKSVGALPLCLNQWGICPALRHSVRPLSHLAELLLRLQFYQLPLITRLEPALDYFDPANFLLVPLQYP